MATLAWAPVAISINPAKATRKERMYFWPPGGWPRLSVPRNHYARIPALVPVGQEASLMNETDFFASWGSSSPGRMTPRVNSSTGTRS
jgi:hypothetical protein